MHPSVEKYAMPDNENHYIPNYIAMPVLPHEHLPKQVRSILDSILL